jgi:hypothetical protein
MAAGKPAEYGRFAIEPDIAVCIAAVVGANLFVKTRWIRAIVLGALLLAVIIPGLGYLRGFVGDRGASSTRLRAARWLDEGSEGARRSIAVWAEPAPYAVPPVNLFRARLVLLPEGYILHEGEAEAVVRAVDQIPKEPAAGGYDRVIVKQDPITPISWANKPFVIDEKREATRDAIRPPSSQKN